MHSGLSLTGLSLVWLGAIALGILLILRGRSHSLPPHWWKTVEAVCIFAGTGGLVGGLSLLGLGSLP